MTYSIVDSVKGGSGKTCFALFLAFMKCRDTIPIPPLYFDLDFPGTAIESILFDEPPLVGKMQKVKNKGQDEGRTLAFVEDEYGTLQIANHYLNYILNGSYQPQELITSMKFRTKHLAERSLSDEEGKEDDSSKKNEELWEVDDLVLPLDMIISSPRFKDKRGFKGTGNDAVNVSQFRYKLSSLIKNVKDKTRTDYTDMVFDMPPGTERYSDCLYDILLFQDDPAKASYQIAIDKKDNIDIYQMTTLDLAHINATVEYVCNFCNESIHKNINIIHQFYIVINDSRNAYETKKDSNGKEILNPECLVGTRIKYLKEQLKDKIKEDDPFRKKIKIVVYGYNDNYLNVCLGNSYFEGNHHIPLDYLDKMAQFLKEAESL